jgi:hypothetical protein
MTLTQKLASALVVLAVAGAVVLTVTLMNPAKEETTAQGLADMVAADPVAAKNKLHLHWFRVSGKVLSNLPVQDIDGQPYQMVELANDKKVEIHASFTGKDVQALKAGVEAVIDGHCALCDKGVLLFDRCTVVSVKK